LKFECAHDALVDVHTLQPNPKNPNKHPARQIELLAKIISYQGQRSPIVVSNRSGFIVKGHGRLDAVRKLGWAQAAVDYQDYESEAQEYADMVADNKIAELAEHDDNAMIDGIKTLGITDFELLGLDGFSLPEVIEPQCDEDEVPTEVETRCKPGDIWTLGRHRLMCGSSTVITDVDSLLEGNKAELCFTSPPYSDQRDYNGGKELHPDEMASFITCSAHRVEFFAINLGYSRKDGEVDPYWNFYIDKAKANGLKLLSWNIWDKGECGSIGNQTAMFGISHEWIFVFGVKKKDLNRTVENKSAGYLANHNGHRQKDGSIKKGKDRIVGEYSQLKTVYKCTAQKARDEINHPARFPVEFPEGYIEALTDEHQSVYEPFGGSGSTLIACEKANRRCFMMEIDPRYCDIILTRWEKYTGKTAECVNG
jgi:DNA modification methylase